MQYCVLFIQTYDMCVCFWLIKYTVKIYMLYFKQKLPNVLILVNFGIFFLPDLHPQFKSYFEDVNFFLPVPAESNRNKSLNFLFRNVTNSMNTLYYQSKKEKKMEKGSLSRFILIRYDFQQIKHLFLSENRINFWINPFFVQDNSLNYYFRM